MHDVHAVHAGKSSDGVGVVTGNVTSRRHDVTFQHPAAATANNRNKLDAFSPSIFPSPRDPVANLSGKRTFS